MTIERKDLRIKLTSDDHAGLTLLAEADQLELAEWAEAVLVKAIRHRIHAAILVAGRAQRLGIAGKVIPHDE